MKKTLVTSALPYSNGFIHLGHISGAYLPADIYVRYLRLKSEDVMFVCGSDEHGVAITIAAEKEKVTPQDIIDKYHFANKEAFEGLGISFDIYSRTSNPMHHQTAREFFEDLLKKEYLIKKESEQFYDPDANMFLPDRYVEGVCPNCGFEHARGDQCDNCGAYYSQTELNNPISLVSNKTPILKKTSHWYLQFSKFQSFLEDFINSKEGIWKENVIRQTKSWLKEGLTERAITRDLEWGVKIDGLKGVEDSKVAGKRLYVWFDAVLGYITATKENLGDESWRDWWQNPETNYLAFIGKDNIVFHTLIFPAMLHARKDEDNPYILPTNVPAHEFLNLEGEKFSKSRNWSIDLKDFLKDHPEKFKTDVLRYTLAMNFPETRDADFTWTDFANRNNNELAAILGNFINRSIQFLHKNFEGKVPELSGSYSDLLNSWNDSISGDITLTDDTDITLASSIKEELKSISENFAKFRFRDGITSMMNIARASNKYFNDEQPWKTIKSNPQRAAKAMFVCSNLAYSLGLMFSPLLPETSKYIQSLFGNNIETGEVKSTESIWNTLFRINYNSETKVNKPDIIFSKLDEKFIETEQSKLGFKNKKQDEKDLISIDDFKKVKLRSATILSAEKIKKSDKLLKLKVDLGDEKRQIIAGIAKNYNPQDLIGNQVVIVANLKPAKLMGELSEGMILASNSDNGLELVSFKNNVPNGSEVR